MDSQVQEMTDQPGVYVFWFRMFVETNARPEFAILSNESLGVYVRLLAAGANQAEHGVLAMSRTEIALSLRMSVADLEKALAELEARGLVETTDQGVAIVMRERHYDLSYSNSPEGRRERKRRQRQREREGSYEVAYEGDLV